jgi:hypothetical protein
MIMIVRYHGNRNCKKQRNDINHKIKTMQVPLNEKQSSSNYHINKRAAVSFETKLHKSPVFFKNGIYR